MTGAPEKNEYPKATNGFVFGSLLTYAAAIALMMAFCSPYWVKSYEETMSSFKNMGIWEYCFRDFSYPYYPLPKLFNGCHNIYSHEFHIIRGWILPPWLIAVQTFVTVAFIITFFVLIVMSFVLIRIPLKIVLQFEWLLVRISSICCLVSSLCLFLAVATFGANAYRRDWMMYPRFNVLSWSYALAVIAFMVLGIAGLILHREGNKLYQVKSEAKNLVMQMEEQNPQQPRPYSRSTIQSGYM